MVAAKRFGFFFYEKNPNGLIRIRERSVEHPDSTDVQVEEKTYRILDVLEFTSTRKRMSVIAHRVDGESGARVGELMLFVKGADSGKACRFSKFSFRYSFSSPLFSLPPSQKKNQYMHV